MFSMLESSQIIRFIFSDFLHFYLSILSYSMTRTIDTLVVAKSDSLLDQQLK